MEPGAVACLTRTAFWRGSIVKKPSGNATKNLARGGSSGRLEGFVQRVIIPTHFMHGFYGIVAHLSQGAESELLKDHRNGFGWVPTGCVFAGVSRGFHASFFTASVVPNGN